jgi:hypothetical protein
VIPPAGADPGNSEDSGVSVDPDLVASTKEHRIDFLFFLGLDFGRRLYIALALAPEGVTLPFFRVKAQRVGTTPPVAGLVAILRLLSAALWLLLEGFEHTRIIACQASLEKYPSSKRLLHGILGRRQISFC